MSQPSPATTTWTIDQARQLADHIDRRVRPLGYLVALYGSVLTQGQGRDLDLLLVPWRPNTDPQLAITTIRIVAGGGRNDLLNIEQTAMRALSALILDADGRAIDLQVRDATDA